MKLNNGKLVSDATVIDAHCECGEPLIELPNGLADKAYACKKCLRIYELELRKVPEKKTNRKTLKKLIEFEEAKAKWVRENREKYLS